MKNTMIVILCPQCGQRLLNTKFSGKRPQAYPIVGKTPEHTDTEIKCHRCKTIVGIDK